MKLFDWLRRGPGSLPDPSPDLPSTEEALINLKLGHVTDRRPLGDDEWAAIDRLLSRGREHEAMELLRRVVAALPGDLAATLRLCEILCGRLEHHAARPLLERLVSSPPHRERALILIAEGLERAGDVRGALAHYERVLATHLDHVRARAAADRLRRDTFGPDVDGNTAPITLDGPAQVSTAVGGRYRLLSELGRGASGAVYLAQDEEVGREVALKILHPRSTDDAAEARHRAWQEARAAASLCHPGVAVIYDLDEDRGMIAMELCRGGSLRDRLQHGAFLPLDALRALEQLADALRAAHARGVIHGDVKPANVLLRRERDGSSQVRDDEVVLCDFGVAQIGDSNTEARATRGTLVYMAPEQRRGELTPAADLFAAGMVALELLSGPAVILARSQDRAALLRGDRLHEGRLATELLFATRDDTEALLQKMLAADPKSRPSAREVSQAARALAEKMS